MKGITIEHQSSFCVANTLVARFVYRFFSTKLMILWPSILFLVELMVGEKQQNLQGSTENVRTSGADGERSCG